MEASALMDAHVQLKRIYTALNEALDLTRQLADAVDRDDQVATQMLIAMRQEPTDKLAGAHQVLAQQRQTLPPADAERLAAILKGAAAETEAEAPLAGRRQSAGLEAACGFGPGGQPQAGAREVHLPIR